MTDDSSWLAGLLPCPIPCRPQSQMTSLLRSVPTKSATARTSSFPETSFSRTCYANWVVLNEKLSKWPSYCVCDIWTCVQVCVQLHFLCACLCGDQRSASGVFSCSSPLLKIKNFKKVGFFLTSLCVCVCVCAQCHSTYKEIRGQRASVLFFPDIELRLAGFAGSTATHWAISQAPPLYSLRQALSLNPGLTVLSRQTDQLSGGSSVFLFTSSTGATGTHHHTQLLCGSGVRILMLTHLALYHWAISPAPSYFFFYSITQTSINWKIWPFTNWFNWKQCQQDAILGNFVSCMIYLHAVWLQAWSTSCCVWSRCEIGMSFMLRFGSKIPESEKGLKLLVQSFQRKMPDCM